jgi:putative component of membrane protein insertase Oxa1/YidC/SpoIIIJ protein YidD
MSISRVTICVPFVERGKDLVMTGYMKRGSFSEKRVEAPQNTALNV